MLVTRCSDATQCSETPGCSAAVQPALQVDALCRALQNAFGIDYYSLVEEALESIGLASTSILTGFEDMLDAYRHVPAHPYE